MKGFSGYSRSVLGWYCISAGAFGLFSVLRSTGPLLQRSDRELWFSLGGYLAAVSILFALSLFAGATVLLRWPRAKLLFTIVMCLQVPVWELPEGAFHFFGGLYAIVGYVDFHSFFWQWGLRVGAVIALSGTESSRFVVLNVAPIVLLIAALRFLGRSRATAHAQGAIAPK